MSEVALEFGGQIPSGGGGGCCALLGPGRERLCIVIYFCDFWVVGCGSALPSMSNFCARAIFATVSMVGGFADRLPSLFISYKPIGALPPRIFNVSYRSL